MTSEIINISWTNVALTTLLVIATGGCSLYLKLRLEKDLIVGTIRTFLQLFLLGYVLKIVFAINNPWIVFAIFSFMIFFAARIISGRVKEKRIPYFMPVLASMFLSYMVINSFVMAVIVQVKPWYYPVYFIPVGGMIIGNSMNAIAIAINNWFEGLKMERDRIELYLSLGATPVESCRKNFKDAISSGMIPSINALMSVGVVSIPGMMTGQMLAGTDPLIAIKYQIVIMLLLVGSTALSTIFSLHIVRRLSFTPSQQLKI
ncbi:MAG: iron export ABC transporter permease subunit FetB [Thermodesulfovibrionia bacterium]|nr:iron export ABC transporter permease subunit FetB [Thermodesulfovibrionia bacterium]